MVYDKYGNFYYSYRIQSQDLYVFTVDEEDNIVVIKNRSQSVSVYNQDGLLVETYPDIDSNLLFQYKGKGSTTTTVTGINYKLSNFLGYTKVSTNNPVGVVYRIPLRLYFAKLAIPIAFVSLMVVLGHVAAKFYRLVYPDM